MVGDLLCEFNACGGFAEPPPEFSLPPPPRPTMLDGLSFSTCLEMELSLKSSQNWDVDMCKAFLMIEERFRNNEALKTPIIVGVFCLMFLLTLLISSLFLWKKKRKVQSCLTSKNKIHGTHINGIMGTSLDQPRLYDLPTSFNLEHCKRFRSNYHTVKFIERETKKLSNAYPIVPPSKPCLTCPSVVDAFSSNDNIYEELLLHQGSNVDYTSSMESVNKFTINDILLQDTLANKSRHSHRNWPMKLGRGATSCKATNVSLPRNDENYLWTSYTHNSKNSLFKHNSHIDLAVQDRKHTEINKEINSRRQLDEQNPQTIHNLNIKKTRNMSLEDDSYSNVPSMQTFTTLPQHLIGNMTSQFVYCKRNPSFGSDSGYGQQTSSEADLKSSCKLSNITCERL